jgi:hypothetical protein
VAAEPAELGATNAAHSRLWRHRRQAQLSKGIPVRMLEQVGGRPRRELGPGHSRNQRHDCIQGRVVHLDALQTDVQRFKACLVMSP